MINGQGDCALVKRETAVVNGAELLHYYMPVHIKGCNNYYRKNWRGASTQQNETKEAYSQRV